MYYGYNLIRRGDQGNIYKMGGTYFIDKNGIVLLEHKDKYVNDYLSY